MHNLLHHVCFTSGNEMLWSDELFGEGLSGVVVSWGVDMTAPQM